MAKASCIGPWVFIAKRYAYPGDELVEGLHGEWCANQ